MLLDGGHSGFGRIAWWLTWNVAWSVQQSRINVSVRKTRFSILSRPECSPK